MRSYCEKIVDKSIYFVGKTDWYSNMHRERFTEIVKILDKYKIKNETRILEVGTWPGYLAVCFYYMGIETVGLDLLPERILHLHEKNINIIKLDLEKTASLPFPDNSFDFISTSEIIEHLEKNYLGRIFCEFKRILRPGGIIILTTPNKFSMAGILGRLKTKNVSHGHGHKKEYDLWELQKKLKGCGLEIIEKQACNFYINVGKSADFKYFYPLLSFLKYPNKLHNFLKLLIIPLRLIPIFRDSIIIVAKK
jgi:SAM-dependent methyltransferase